MQRGFTVLELMISLAIIGIVIAIVKPNLTQSKIKKEFRNSFQEIVDHLKTARIESITRNTTTRVLLTGTAGNYTMTAFFSASPTTTCDASGTWTQLYSHTLSLSDRFVITGTGVGNVCFYRDNSSNGADYSLDQVDGGTEYGAGTINVSIATGYIDATLN